MEKVLAFNSNGSPSLFCKDAYSTSVLKQRPGQHSAELAGHSKEGVSWDRILSVHDPEMRHRHKSSSTSFNGHKAAAVDTDSQLIAAVEVLPGNAWDSVGALELVKQSEENTGMEVGEAIGDAAYGDGAIRQAFADAGRTLIAKLPSRPDKAHFPKEDFKIDLQASTCTCV